MRTASHKQPKQSNPQGRLRLHLSARTRGGRPVSPLRPDAYHHWLSNPQWANSSSPANKSLRGSRGPEAGVRGIPHASLLPLMLMRKDFLDEVLVKKQIVMIGG